MPDEKSKAVAAKSDKAEVAKTDDKADATPEPEPTGPLVDRDRLIWSAFEFFGTDPHVVAGALAGMDGRKAEFTLDEVRDEIADFLKRPVKEG